MWLCGVRASQHTKFSLTHHKECNNLVSGWRAQGVDQVHGCLEATGRYGEAVAEWLYEQGHTGAHRQPRLH